MQWFVWSWSIAGLTEGGIFEYEGSAAAESNKNLNIKYLKLDKDIVLGHKENLMEN